MQARRSPPWSPLLAVALLLVCLPGPASGAEPPWRHLSSSRNELPPPPGGSKQQTSAVVGDFDGDGLNDFIIGFRQRPPALVGYHRTNRGWDPYILDKDYLTIEAGGAVHDIDGDGDLDVVFGGDSQSPEVWWWENPNPFFDPEVPWKRRLIKRDGKHQHHDQVFGDFLGTGKPQLAFWNQQAKALFLAEIPADSRNTEPWPFTQIHSGGGEGPTPYTEGLSAADVDHDGKIDLLGYNLWFKHTGGTSFKAIKIGDVGGLIFAGHFSNSRIPEIVISPGDGTGPVRIYACAGNPEDPADWKGRALVDRPVVHGHSLQIGDINRDGHLDIFVAEMAQWRDRELKPDHPDATAWILLGDGRGNFRTTELVRGHGWHEARLADLDGDGDLDILNKPYTWQTPRVDAWLNPALQTGP